MSVIRCPRCGRAADGVECLACGYLWAAAAPMRGPDPVTGIADGDGIGQGAPPPSGVDVETRDPPPMRGAFPPPPITFGGPAEAGAAQLLPGPPPLPSRRAAESLPGAMPTPTTNPSLSAPTPPSPPVALDAVPPAPVTRASRVASWVVAAVPPGSGLERFLRSPLAFVTSGVASFVVVLGFGSLLLLGGADPELSRVDGGKAGAVIEELLAVPVAERTPRQSLLLGHAYARNGATRQALDAYGEAAKQGGADRRALDYTLAALDHPLATHPIEVLTSWPSEDLEKRLLGLTESEGWHLRHNALKVLEARGQASPALAERVAIVDVRQGPDCERRREGLARLAAIGKGKAALEAIQSLRDNYKENFCIPLTELDRAQLSVEQRR